MRILLFLCLCFLTFSCAKETTDDSLLPKTDNVFIVNEDGKTLKTYTFDLNTNTVKVDGVIQATLRDSSEHTTYYGIRTLVEPNGSQGLNYYCLADPDAVCYSK